MSEIPKFHLISWCGNLVETHSFRIASRDSPKTLQKLRVSKNTKIKMWNRTKKVSSQHHILTIKSVRIAWENIKVNSKMITAKNSLVWKLCLSTKFLHKEIM